MAEVDAREIPPVDRHDQIHQTFADMDPGETLTLINDHDPKPLYYEMEAEVSAFDADSYVVEREAPSRFVAQFPKAAVDGPSVDRVQVSKLDGEPHTEVFPGETPKTIRLSLDSDERVPAHDHPEHVVLFHVLSGAIDVRVGDETHHAAAGDLLRFDGDNEVEPTAREDSTALVVLCPQSVA